MSTVNSALRVLRRILTKAVEWHQPAEGKFFITLDKFPKFTINRKKENRRTRVVKVKEETPYLKHARAVKPDLADVMTILFDTSMRPDECFRLCWEGVKWDTGLYGKLRIVYGKSTNAQRELPMSGRVYELLQSRWEAAGGPAEGLVFPAPTASGHIEASSLKKAHTKACKNASVKRFIFYDARHTSLTRLAGACHDPYTVMAIAGHSNVEMSKVYVKPEQYENLTDGCGWWNEWWEFRQYGKKPSASVSVEQFATAKAGD